MFDEATPFVAYIFCFFSLINNLKYYFPFFLRLFLFDYVSELLKFKENKNKTEESSINFQWALIIYGPIKKAHALCNPTIPKQRLDLWIGCLCLLAKACHEWIS